MLPSSSLKFSSKNFQLWFSKFQTWLRLVGYEGVCITYLLGGWHLKLQISSLVHLQTFLTFSLSLSLAWFPALFLFFYFAFSSLYRPLISYHSVLPVSPAGFAIFLQKLDTLCLCFQLNLQAKLSFFPYAYQQLLFTPFSPF